MKTIFIASSQSLRMRGVILSRLWAKLFFFQIVFCFCSHVSFSQRASISGKIIDATSNEPLHFANIFLNRTSLGATSNLNGEFRLERLPMGDFDLIVSFVGYQSYQTKVSLQQDTHLSLTVRLSLEDVKLKPIEVSAKPDKEWKRQLDFFEKHFLGKAAKQQGCSIINPEVLSFNKQQSTFTATATEPLRIENKKLGYLIHFQLKQFSYSSDKFLILGNVFFSPEETQDKEQQVQWDKNRENAYRGSTKHLFKSMVERRAKEEGFSFHKVNNPHELFDNFGENIESGLISKIDESAFVISTPQKNVFHIVFSDRFEVHYNKKPFSHKYYSDIRNFVGWINVKGGVLKVLQDGTVLNPADLFVEGDFSAGLVGAMLPSDYKPLVQLPQEADEERFFEYPMLLSDRSVYHPGETIWFSSYFKYYNNYDSQAVSRVLYVDLITKSGKIIKSLNLRVEQGKSNGQIKLPQSIALGEYVLRGYTNWMRNFSVNNFCYVPLLVTNQNRSPIAPPSKIDTSQISIDLSKVTFSPGEKASLVLQSKIQTKLTVSLGVCEDLHPAPRPNGGPGQPEIMQELKKSDYNFAVETGLTLQANLKPKPVHPEKVIVWQQNADYPSSEMTDDHGVLKLVGLNFTDSTNFYYQSMGLLDLVPTIPPAIPDLLPKVSFAKNENLERPIAELTEADTETRILDEVTIVAKRIQYENPEGPPEAIITQTDLKKKGGTLANAIKMLNSRFKIVYFNGHTRFVLKENGFPGERIFPEPLLYIDGQLFFPDEETVGDRLNRISTVEIEKIEINVLSSQQIANGVACSIWLFTKQGDDKSSKKGLKVLRLKGYDVGQSFDRSQTNFTTQVWQPFLNLSYDKEKIIEFLVPNVPGVYRVTLQGLDEKGNYVMGEQKFNVIEK